GAGVAVGVEAGDLLGGGGGPGTLVDGLGPAAAADALVVGDDHLADGRIVLRVDRVEVGGHQALVLQRRPRAVVTVDGYRVVPPDADQNGVGVRHRDGVRVAAHGGAGQRVDVDGLLDRTGLGVDQREAVVVRVGHHQDAAGREVLGRRLQAHLDLLDLLAGHQVDLGHRAGARGAGDLVGHDAGAGRVVGVLAVVGWAAAFVGDVCGLAGQHHLTWGVADLDDLDQLVGRRVDDAELVDDVQRHVQLAAVRAERHPRRPIR